MSDSIIDGVIKDFGKDPSDTQIQLCAAALSSRGYLLNSNKSKIFQAISVLNTLNIVPSRETITFSLASADNKDEGIDKPLIADPDIGALTPEPESSEDKFPAYKEDQVKDSVDAFYEQDEELTERQKIEAERLKKRNIQMILKMAQGFSVEIAETPQNKSVNKYLTRKIFRREL